MKSLGKIVGSAAFAVAGTFGLYYASGALVGALRAWPQPLAAAAIMAACVAAYAVWERRQ